MRTQPAVTRFIRAEWQKISRDPMLRGMLLLLPLLMFLIRWLLPWITRRFEIDLTPYHPLIMSAVVVFVAPVLVGYIIGMILLDERDQGLLPAISTTQLPLWQYLSWKLILPVVIASVATIGSFPVINVLPLKPNYLAPIALSALWAPLLALIMACFARNKLQGFVLMRISGIFLMLPLLAWYFPQWDVVFAIFPAYWPSKAFWLATENKGQWLQILIGTAFHGVLIMTLYRRFRVSVGIG